MNCHLKRTLKTGHSHSCLLSTYYAVVGLGGSAVGAEKNGVLVFKALADPWGKQMKQINFKIKQEVPQIPPVQNTGRLHLTQSEKPGRASWKS